MADFKKILVNGKEVEIPDLQNIPDTLKDMLVDKNANGIPDSVEGILNLPIVKQLIGDGLYAKIDQMPPEQREKIQGMLQQLSRGATPNTTNVELGHGHQHSISIGSGSPSPLAGKAIDWQRMQGSEQPGMISVKAIIFATVAILGLFIFAFIVWRLM